MKNKKIIIIGGGIVGICAAYYLSKKDYDITVVDKGDFTTGCSFGNAGMIVPSHFIPLAAPGMISMGLKWMFDPESPFHIKPRFNKEILSWMWKFYQASTHKKVKAAIPLLKSLNLLSRNLYNEITINESLEFGFKKKGLLMFCKDKKHFEAEIKVAKEAKKLGLAAEVLNPKEAQSLDPTIQLAIEGAIYFPNDAFLTPHLFLHGMKTKLETQGVTFLANTEITNFAVSQNKIQSIQSNQCELKADEYLIATGAWSSTLSKKLKVHIPLMAGKGYSVLLPHPPAMPQICSILTEARVAVTPMADGLRIAGTMQLDGLDETIDMRRVNGIFKSIGTYFPQFTPDDFKNLVIWSGLRPCSPDGLPYIGKSIHYHNLSIATGHAMMGLSLGPITGKLIAQIISNEPVDIPLDLVGVDRYL